jgi:hypothetical protein
MGSIYSSRKRSYGGLVQKAAKAVVSRAIDNRLAGEVPVDRTKIKATAVGQADEDIWRALIDTPIVQHADAVGAEDLYLVTSNM